MPPITISKGRSPAPEQNPSFTQMADTDLETIGRHCQYEYCGQLDFLPFRCESCKGTYCLDHRTETAHQCPRAGEWARRRAGPVNTENIPPPQKPSIYNTDQCAHVQCKTLINTLKDPAVRCPQCTRQYCLKHRLREEHDCAKITPPAAARGSARAGNDIKSVFSRMRTWGRDKQQAVSGAGLLTLPKLKPKANSAAARMVEVNKIKRAAKGDAGVPVEKRIYLHAVGTVETKSAEPPAGDFFFDERWKVGRVLDDVAKRLRVQNLNNRVDGEDAKLRMFHVESGAFLEFSESIGGGKVKQGDTVVLLRGAGSVLGSS